MAQAVEAIPTWMAVAIRELGLTKCDFDAYFREQKDRRDYGCYCLCPDGRFYWVCDSTYDNYEELLSYGPDTGFFGNNFWRHAVGREGQQVFLTVERETDIVVLHWDGSKWTIDEDCDPRFS